MDELRLETLEQLARRLEKSSGARVWGYVRVSSQKQADNESIPAQIDAIRGYCRTKGFETPGFVVEIGSAAKPIFVVNLPGAPKQEASVEASPRPKFLLLLGFLREVKPAHLIVWKLDRLARIEYEQELFLDMMRRDGITPHSVQPAEAHMLDGGYVNDPQRVFCRQIMAAAAQYDRALIELRMKTGLSYKAARGGFTGGIPPFGYKAEKKDLKPDPDEVRVVRFIFWLTHRYRMGPSAIAQHLNETAPQGTPNFPRQKVSRVLGSQALYRGSYKDCFGQIHQRPDLVILPDDFEELDDEFAK